MVFIHYRLQVIGKLIDFASDLRKNLNYDDSLTDSSVTLTFPEGISRPTFKRGCSVWAAEPHLDIAADFSGTDPSFRGFFFMQFVF